MVGRRRTNGYEENDRHDTTSVKEGIGKMTAEEVDTMEGDGANERRDTMTMEAPADGVHATMPTGQ